jgi:hypothetical protein
VSIFGTKFGGGRLGPCPLRAFLRPTGGDPNATNNTDATQHLFQRLHEGTLEAPWHLEDGLFLHGSRIFVPDHGNLRCQVLALAHSVGHEGVQKTLHRLRAEFYIPSDSALVQD